MPNDHTDCQRKLDGWEAEAKRYAENADYWQGRFDTCQRKLEEAEAKIARYERAFTCQHDCDGCLCGLLPESARALLDDAKKWRRVEHEQPFTSRMIDGLFDKLEAAGKERDALRKRVEELEATTAVFAQHLSICLRILRKELDGDAQPYWHDALAVAKSVHENPDSEARILLDKAMKWDKLAVMLEKET